MAWYNNQNRAASRTFSQDSLAEDNRLSFDGAKALADKLGLDLTYDKSGNPVVVPNYSVPAGSGEFNNFIDFWTNFAKSDSRLESERKKRYSHYDVMDRVMAEAMIMLDTYADEVLSTGFVLDPIEITISDKDAEIAVIEILRKNKIFEKLRSIVRNLAKWGDLGFQIRFGNQLGPFEQKNTTGPTSKTVALDPEVYDPRNMSIDIHTPEVWDIKMDPQLKVPLLYTYEQDVGYISKDTNVNPLSFVQFSLPDEEMFPYGRSILDPLKTIFDQLSTIEALLAISRASRVERLIVKIPTTAENPTAALAQLQAVRGQWKNMIFTDGASGKRSYPRTPSLTDILFIPSMDGFEISPLKPSIDIASIADVEHFRDKAITATGLPKGYFLADDSTDWGGALAAQDLKFARKLIPIQDALCQGMTKLAMVICAYLGYDVRHVDIRTKVKRPIQIADPILASYMNISRAARTILEDFGGFADRDETGQLLEKNTQEMYLNMIRSFGMSEDVINVLEKKDNLIVKGIDPNKAVATHALVNASEYSSKQVLAAAGFGFRDNLVALYENIRRS